jgi:two-component system, NtrC family, response regulator AtoC
MAHVLIVEDDPSSRTALAELVALEGFDTVTAGSLEEARSYLKTVIPDLLITDLVLPDGNGIELFDTRRLDAALECVVITGHASVDSAVDALRLGAADYLTKPIDVARLSAILSNIRRTQELKEEIDVLRGELRKLGRFGPMIGASPEMGRVYDLMARVAPTDATVFLTGESGTGKDVAAQTIHQLSRRRKLPFLPLNCGAVSPNLIETELFGHERGSFTGADRLHKGYFERADGGTLFLDEVTEMPIELQVKLLRVLETGTIMRIGGEQPMAVDVRVIAATNRLPLDAVKEGKLREDLLYRLNVFPIPLPPLRDRGGDVGLLVDHFLKELNATEGRSVRVGADSAERLLAHAWPGNVRELKNALHRAFILADQEITPDCLPEDIRGGTVTSLPGKNGSPMLKVQVGESVADAERRLILATLEHYHGSKQKAAEVLGISLKTLYNRLSAYGSES